MLEAELIPHLLLLYYWPVKDQQSSESGRVLSRRSSTFSPSTPSEDAISQNVE